MEPTIYQAVKESIGLGEDDPYYNSGVLLTDLKQWREQEVQKKLLDFWKSKGGKLFASDQDVINGTLKGQIYTLMPRYNFFTNYRYFSYRELTHLGKDLQSRNAERTADCKAASFHYPLHGR